MESEASAELGGPVEAVILRQRADRVARELLGALLVRRHRGVDLVARIVETEAYLGECDRASHAWGGRRSARNRSLYLPGGHTYVFFVYGMHHCFNVVTGDESNGEAVLIRAAEAVVGADRMRRLRGRPEPLRHGDLLGGPARLCQALAIDLELDGLRLPAPEIELRRGRVSSDEPIVCGPRVGVDYAQEAAGWPLRFALRDHSEVSRPRPSEPLRRYRDWRASEPFGADLRPCR